MPVRTRDKAGLGPQNRSRRTQPLHGQTFPFGAINNPSNYPWSDKGEMQLPAQLRRVQLQGLGELAD